MEALRQRHTQAPGRNGEGGIRAAGEKLWETNKPNSSSSSSSSQQQQRAPPAHSPPGPGPQHLRRLSPGIPPPRPRHTRPRGSPPRGPAGPPPPPCAPPPLPRAGREGLELGKRGRGRAGGRAGAGRSWTAAVPGRPAPPRGSPSLAGGAGEPRGGPGRRRGPAAALGRADYLTCRCGEFISLCLRNGVCCGTHCLGKKPGCKVSETKLE